MFLDIRTHTEESTAPTPALTDIKRKIFTTLHNIQSTGFDVLLQDLFQKLQVMLQI